MDFTPGLAVDDEVLTLPQEEEEEDDDYEGVKKRLFDSGDLETPVTKTSKQPVLVYLRIRPKSQLELLNKDSDCLHVYDEQELLAVAPKSSQTYKNKLGTRCLQEGSQKFTFTKIFRPLTTQKELFDESLMSTLKDFFSGQNCLLFTYGVTNSGKTYTVTGTPTDPGILPRSLDVIFNSIDQQQLSHVSVKPKHFSDVAYLSKEEASAMEARKDNTLNKAREMLMLSQGPFPGQQAVGETAVDDETELLEDHDISSVSTISKASSNLTDIDGGSFAEFQHDESSIELDCVDNQQFSIWVSFAEIYNEFIYDLLADPPAKGKQRTVLKIAEDKNRNHFIKGLQEVQVGTVDEAMLLLRLGLQHRHVAHTKLNYNSSRSHSVYTIKLIRVVNVDQPTRALVNRISIVDLAGAERSAKTGATGVRIKEAGNINNSLLTLGKCIEAMRHNQSKRGGEERVVPFRESKLTRLFQNYFVGTGKGKSLRQGKITMFVNVSNNASVFDETVHVLKFSALTSKIVPMTKVVHGFPFASTSTCPPPTSLRPPPSHHPPNVTSLTAARTERRTKHEGAESRVEGVAAMSWEAGGGPYSSTTEGAECSKCKCLSDQLAQCTEEAKAKISELQVKLIEQEYSIRQEVSQEFSEQLTEIEKQHTHELEEQAVEYEEMYEKRFKLLQQSAKRVTSRKRRRQDDDDADVSDQSHRAEVANLKERVSELEEELAMEKNRAAAEVHDAMESYESKVVILNKQLVEMAMKTSSREKELNSEREIFNKQLQEAKEKAEELSAKLDEEQEKVRVHQEEYEEAILQLRQKCSELRSELKETRHVQNEELQEKLSVVEKKNSALARKASDACAEEEILQARISELTSENSTLEVAKCNLLKQIQTLAKEKETFETAKSELRELSEQREVDLRAASERHSKEMCALEEKLTAVQEQLSASSGQVQKLTDEVATIQAARSELEGKLLDFTSQRETKESTVNDQLKQERLQSDNKDKELTTLRAENQAQLQQIRELEEKLVALQNQLDRSLTRVTELTSEAAQIETVKCDLNSALAKLAVKQEAMYKLEEAKEQLEKEACELRMELKLREETVAKLTAQMEELSEKHVLYESFMKTLKDYETTLEKQSTYIREVEEEKEGLHTQNEELLQKVTEMEHQLTKTTSSQDSLTSKIEELEKALEDSCQKLTRREAELMDGASKCRETMESQQADLRKQCSSLEQEVATLREDSKAFQQQLREKESELLKLAKSVGLEKSALADMTQRLEEARQLAEQRQSQLEAMQGNHQLEVAQLNIKLREVTAELDEAHAMYSQHSAAGSHSTEGERGSGGDEEEHIYEEPPEEDAGDHEDPVYDTVEDLPAGQPLASVENKPAKARRSYLEAVGGQGGTSDVKDELDVSKPYVPVLERSSQLIDDSFLDESQRMEIDATPLPLRKKARKLKAKSAKARKRSIEAVDKENDQLGGSPLPKKTRPQRARQKPQRYEEEVSSIENFTPTSQKTYKQKSLRQRILGTGKSKKSKAVTTESTPANVTDKSGNDCIASRTRQRKCVLTKSQISGPLELRDSPKGSRNALEAKAVTQLGSMMRPVSNC